MRPPNLPAPRYLERRVTGTPEHVANTVRTLRRSGRLLAMTEPRQAHDGRVWVDVRIRDHAPVVKPRRRRQVAVYVAAVGVAVLGVAVYALIQLVNALIDALPYLLGAAGLLALVAILTGGARKAACVTFHRPGCRHH